MKNEIEYSNTDLELWSKSNLSNIAVELEDKISILHNGFCPDGNYLLSFEAINNTDSPDSVINEFYDLYINLSKESKLDWNSSYKKNLIIGYQSGNGEVVMEHSISKQTLEKITEVGLSLGICVYPIKDKNNT